MPGDPLGDGASKDRADQRRQPSNAPEDPHCPAPAVGRERRVQQRKRERHNRCRASPLQGTRRDQPSDAGRQRTRRGGRSEQPKADGEQPTAPESVAEGGRGHQQHSEAQGVGVDRPLQLLDRGAEVTPDRRQRGGDDQEVKHDHERR
ncbi:MAG TPA: hypothetical protein VK162_01630 [Streptosporangiaceae bacterium]|nr:hypothetical protein [Streptosporangiaceae bacterium]